MDKETGTLTVKNVDKALLQRCKKKARSGGMLFSYWVKLALAEKLEK